MSNIQSTSFQKLTIKLLIILSLAFYSVNAQENVDDYMWNSELGLPIAYNGSFLVSLSSEELKKMKSLWKEIGEDLKIEKNPFSGTYINLKSDSGYFLRWSLNKGFILIFYRDQSMVVDVSYGKVNIENQWEVFFDVEKDLSSGYFKKTPRVWIPVVNSKYLVPKENVALFGDYYGGFGDFNGYPRNLPCENCFFFANRFENNNRQPSLNFLAPPKYLKYIKQPIEAEITLVGKRRIVLSSLASGVRITEKNSATFVVINKGRKDNITEGLLFLLDEGKRSFDEVLKITKVNENSSEGIVYRFVDKNGKDVYNETYNEELKEEVGLPSPLLKKGIKVATSFKE